MTERDELMRVLGELNTATATFSTEVFTGEAGRESCIAMAVLLLHTADLVLGHLVRSGGS